MWQGETRGLICEIPEDTDGVGSYSWCSVAVLEMSLRDWVSGSRNHILNIH